jgi:hypothetical protein
MSSPIDLKKVNNGDTSSSRNDVTPQWIGYASSLLISSLSFYILGILGANIILLSNLNQKLFLYLFPSQESMYFKDSPEWDKNMKAMNDTLQEYPYLKDLHKFGIGYNKTKELYVYQWKKRSDGKSSKFSYIFEWALDWFNFFNCFKGFNAIGDSFTNFNIMTIASSFMNARALLVSFLLLFRSIKNDEESEEVDKYEKLFNELEPLYKSISKEVEDNENSEDSKKIKEKNEKIKEKINSIIFKAREYIPELDFNSIKKKLNTLYKDIYKHNIFFLLLPLLIPFLFILVPFVCGLNAFASAVSTGWGWTLIGFLMFGIIFWLIIGISAVQVIQFIFTITILPFYINKDRVLSIVKINWKPIFFLLGLQSISSSSSYGIHSIYPTSIVYSAVYSALYPSLNKVLKVLLGIILAYTLYTCGTTIYNDLT